MQHEISVNKNDHFKILYADGSFAVELTAEELKKKLSALEAESKQEAQEIKDETKQEQAVAKPKYKPRGMPNAKEEFKKHKKH